VFAHADRTRFVPADYRKMLNPTGGQFRAPILIDGLIAGTWRWERSNKLVVLCLFDNVASRHRTALDVEALRIARFLSPDARVSEER
jgi:hypothetical protein